MADRPAPLTAARPAFSADYADIDLLRTTVWMTSFFATIIMMVASCFPDSVLPMLQA